MMERVSSGPHPRNSVCRVRVTLPAAGFTRVVAEMGTFCSSKTFAYTVIDTAPGKPSTMVWSFSNEEDAALFINRFKKIACLERISTSTHQA
jgi:hypothetical protein